MKVLIIFICIFTSKVFCQDDSYEILSVNVDGLLMKEASIEASATCGMNGPEKFCKLVDEGPGANVMCDICDDRNRTKRHPIEYAKSDDHNLWWQSPSMAQGTEFQRVNITIDLKQVYQIVYILLKMADSPRPGTWILEKSTDGNHYEPWIFFADTPYACFSLFQRHYPKIKLTTSARPQSLGDDEVFCTTYYSQPNSLIAGEIIISLINGRNSLLIQDDLAPKSIPLKLINFLSARFIRFRFLKPLTLAADLMTHRGHLEKSIYNRYYYSLRNIEIGGKCICNNHADKCDKVVQDGIAVAKCNCKHNTCGNNCERCCPLYNQKAWRQGSKCEECNCNNKTRHCTYNQTVATLQLSMNKLGQMDGGGVCTDCSENTAGINCEKCRMGYYRPWNIRATQSSPCKLCSCNGIGTIGTCISNGEETGTQKPGDCICKKGYKGHQCDQCDIGFERSGEECVPCPCSIDGSVGGSMHRCRPPCYCKINVEPASNCRQCKEHFFNLDINDPDGCQPCYCFGITNRCASLSGLNLMVQTLENWKVTTLTMNKIAAPRTNFLQYPILDNSIIDPALDNPSVYYWIAPRIYLGNWLTSFKSIFQYVIKIDVEPSNPGSQIDSPDVIIKCASDEMSHSISSDDRRRQRRVQIPLSMRHWQFLTVSGSTRTPSQDDFMSCLANVRALLIKAKYYSSQASVGLLNVTLDRAEPVHALSNVPHIEKCECPPGVAGLSCESCEVGFRRVNDVLVRGQCERCQCYQHSNSCDPFTGHCKDCLHRTTGQYCDTCEPGFYGTPRNGNTNACKKCACPREDYQLTNMCSTFEEKNYICHECSEKSGGHHCQRCIEGYYGNPLQKIACQKCQCNNNEESCDSITGQCRCSYNTIGTHCDKCLHGFYGNASSKTCRACNCSLLRSTSQFCNQTNGQCACRPNFEGRTCDTCAPGLYLRNDQCIPCSCDQLGRVSSNRFCDSHSGRCKCREGVTGESCDRCLYDHYGFPDCKKCLCSNHSLSSKCDQTDGTCECEPNYADKKCQKCQDRFYWSNRTHCSPCNCGVGSSSQRCDMTTGQCGCAPHVIGRACDKCAFNYYGLAASGCKECPVCTNGRVCDNDGSCVCPSNTRGDTCEHCADQSWGYNKTLGCKKCDCFLPGSLGQTCDINSGQCICHSQFVGHKCNRCAPDYFGFPNCQQCTCHKDGIVPHQVNACDVTTGSCSCKMNVKGDNCDQCKNGTFGFHGSYSAGCYSCFCSMQSNRCSPQTDYRIIFDQQYTYHILSDDGAFVSGRDQRVLELSPISEQRVTWPLSFFRPVFADVSSLLSIPDLSLLYRQVLLIVEIECQGKGCGRENSRQAEVIIESYGGAMELRYFVNHSKSVDSKLFVDLSESSTHGQWFLTKSDNRQLENPFDLGNDALIILNRELFMWALFNVSRVKIQLYSSTVNPEQIKLNVETFVAVKTTDKIGSALIGVEKCECDGKTTGSHCEIPIRGYYRVPFNVNVVNLNVSLLIGYEVKECSCNGHSKQCVKATGHCTDCSNNTIGPTCNLCSDGFYGDPTNNGTCLQCQCPSKEHNFAKNCTKSHESQMFQCECRLGYTGDKCDQCQETFFGRPVYGIECTPCKCNPDGSLSSTCDSSGRCTCAAGVMGAKCDQCTANYAVEDKKCKDCLTGCTKELFVRVNKLNDSVVNMKWKSLPSRGEVILRQRNLSIVLIQKHLQDLTRLDELVKEITKLKDQIQRSNDNLTQGLDQAVKIKDVYKAAWVKIMEIFKDINETISGRQNPRVAWEMHNNATLIMKEIGVVKNKMLQVSEVERELSSVQNHIDKINQIRKIIETRFNLDQLNNLKDMVLKTKLAHTINKENREYLSNLNKTITNYESKMKEYQTKIEETLVEYNGAVLKKVLLVQEINLLKEQLSEFDKKFQMISQTVVEIESILKNFSQDPALPKELIIPDSVKELVNNIVDKSKDLVKNLLKSFAILNRAEDAKHAYSNISKDITDVEEAINSTSRQLEDSRNQLRIDKFSINIKELLTNHTELILSKNKKKNDFQKLKGDYDALWEKSRQMDKDNFEKITEIPRQSYEGNVFATNISSIAAQQNDNQNVMDNLRKSIASIDLPISGDINVTDIEYKVNDLKDQYDGITKETKSIIVSIKDLKESLRKVRERLLKRKIYTELAHGAASKSPEPIRLDKKCVRHYQTYFLPKSNAFSMELYLKPQFLDVQTLVMFGSDSTGGVNKSFALTTEKNNKLKFWYDHGNGVYDLDMDSSILAQSKYTGISISWNLGKWVIKPRSTDEEADSRQSGNSGIDVNNIFLGPQSHIFLGGFPSDNLMNRSNIRMGGKLMETLKDNYRNKYYKGCMYGVTLMTFDLGLQDFHNVEEDCVYSKSANFVLEESFTCKITQSNTAVVDKFKTSIQRQKRDVNSDYNIHFNGHGYMMINTSQVIENSAPCTRLLNKAIRIYTFPHPKINPMSFQFVAVFTNEKLNIGFVLGQQNGKFLQAYWRGNEHVPMREIKSSSDMIVWKVFDKNNDLMFGIDEICDAHSYMYLGGIPDSDPGLMAKLVRLNTPYQSYTGSMKIHVVDKELFRKSSTRFVNKMLKKEKQINGFPFYSLLIPSNLSDKILLTPQTYENVLKKGFSMNLNFPNVPVKEAMTLITIDSAQNKLVLKVSPEHEFTVHLDKETLSVKLSDTIQRWGTYFVVVKIEVKSESTEIYLIVNEQKIQMKEFSVKLDTRVTEIELGQMGIQRSFYVYDIFLGERMVNFNSPSMRILPVNAYLKISAGHLMPVSVSTMSQNPDPFQSDIIRVSSSDSGVLQSDVAALPHTNNRASYSSSIRVGKYILNSFQSEDYPLDSGWFEGLPDNRMSLSGNIIDKFMKPSGNKVSIKVASYSKESEIILSIALESSTTLYLLTMGGHIVLYDPTTKWSSLLRVAVINKDWHLIELSASDGASKGLLVTIDGHSFNFPNGPISFTRPSSINLGGSNTKIRYNSKDIKHFMGCLDNLKINDNKLSLGTGFSSKRIKQCARVLEFLDVGVEILNTYANINAPSDIVKLQIGNYNVTSHKNIITIEFKFKYTGFEQGSLFVTGDGTKFCAIVIIDRKIHLNSKDFSGGTVKTDSLELKDNKWYNVEFIVFHIRNTLTLFKVKVGEKAIQRYLSGMETFGNDFIRPQFYLGGHPGLSDLQRNALMNTNRNFVGCISELNVRVQKVFVTSSLDKSKYIILGRCSVDKFTYLRHL